MLQGFKTIYRSKFWLPFIGAIMMMLCTDSMADENHYKNILVGDRAATLGGAYAAISDDASGGFYNPAGITFSDADSISGSGNAYQSTETTYRNIFNNEDRVRKSSDILPNYFGMVKKFGASTLAVSYVVLDSVVEHLDQVNNINDGTVDRLYISLHSSDKTNLIGPSYAYKINDTTSIGASLFYGSRTFRQQQYDHKLMSSGDTETSYFSSTMEGAILLGKAGIQFSPFTPVSIGFVISKIPRSKGRLQTYSSSNTKGLSILNEEQTIKFPTQFTLGVAYYPSPSLLFTSDIEYYLQEDDNRENVFNESFGTEWFVNANNAVRFGLYSNNDNRKSLSSNTTTPHEKVDLIGYTLGYSSFTRNSSFTLGFISSNGEGEAQIIPGSSEIKKISKKTTTVIFASSYDY